MPGVTSLLHSSMDRRPLPPCPLLFSFKTKQKPEQGIRRMFFLPTKEISGASSKTLASAPGLAATCSILHRLSPITGKYVPQSLGQQLGSSWVLHWVSACHPLRRGETQSQSKKQAKEGFYTVWGRVWMHMEGKLHACVSLFLQGCSWAQ